MDGDVDEIKASRNYVKSIGAKAFDDSAPDARTDPEGSWKWLKDNGYEMNDQGFYWKPRREETKMSDQANEVDETSEADEVGVIHPGRYYRAKRNVYIEIEKGTIILADDDQSADIYQVDPSIFEELNSADIFVTYAQLKKDDTFVDKRGRLNLVRDKTDTYILFSNCTTSSIDPEDQDDDDEDDDSKGDPTIAVFYDAVIAKLINDPSDTDLLYKNADAYMQMKPENGGPPRKKSKKYGSSIPKKGERR